MAGIRIEPGENVHERRCAACDGVNRQVDGFAYSDGFAYGVYYADWCDGDHPERMVRITLALGAWGEGTTGADRRCFAVEWRAGGMRLADEPVIDRPDFLGEFVPRDRALEIGGIEDLWHVADHVVLEDPRVEPLALWLRGG